ncbi:uncharacterized protein BN523_03592 [Bacteroides sp. CAG:189]|nr:uncharacterized protein BN523_03592 [Bacteroides sp. CAG:189]
MRIGAFVLLLIIFFSCQVPKEKMTGRGIYVYGKIPQVGSSPRLFVPVTQFVLMRFY